MPERDEVEDVDSTFKALPVFRTLRTNLALLSSFSRHSVLEPANYSGEDLGFLGVEPGDNQIEVHNSAIVAIATALVTQALDNYFEIKGINPRLEDPDIEKFLDHMENRDKFFRGMKKVRNAVFHAKSRKAWRDRDIAFFNKVFQQRIEVEKQNVVWKLADLLYDFTQKCFIGDLKIWPLRFYEEFEALDPDLHARMNTGDASLEEVIEALRENRRYE